ncbi:MAG TPA: Flp family type IVb pilin [Rhizomicrobium sp.]|nr:Flp family type IVb pilin [Rhizomicrobium sp.]
MYRFFASYLSDESGAAAAEYALILAVVCAGIAAAATTLGGSISTAFTNVGSYLATQKMP